MQIPVVAVVGRPNVGKSTFINRIAGNQDAIVHESSGVTRDRSYSLVDWNGYDFYLIDTGGLALNEAAKKHDDFQDAIHAQAMAAAKESDAIVFMVDSRSGLTNDDVEIMKLLRGTKLPVFLVANKLDNHASVGESWEFMELGMGEPWPVSSLHGHGTGDLLDAIVKTFNSPPLKKRAELSADAMSHKERLSQETLTSKANELNQISFDQEKKLLSIAIIGRPNAGKSTLTNKLSGKERSIVSDIAGTTRDAIDVVVKHDGKEYRFVDTAGIRKKNAMTEDVEYYGFVRALRAIDRADVALLLIDSTLGLTDIDQRVANLAKERDCALVILLNKWDLIDDMERREEIKERVMDRMSFVSYAPIIPISAQTGRSIHRIWAAIELAAKNFNTQIATSSLNKFIMKLNEFGHTAVKGSKRLKLNYATQASTAPPVFTFFVNVPEIVDDAYRRYLENKLRENFDLEGSPIKIRFKKKIEQ